MSYTIYKSDGGAVTVTDNAVDQTYYNPNANGAGKGVGTQLVGNGFAGFYQPMAQNFLQLTENFAGPNMPSDTTALQGQLWFKRNSAADGELYIRTNSLTAGGMTNWTGVVLNKPGAINGLLPPQSGQAGNILSTNGSNPVWMPMGGYTLPIATTSTLGGVKVGSGLSISTTGELANTYTYILPKADYDTLGGVRVGNGLQVDGNGTISVIGGGGGSYVLPPATASVLGGIKVGSGLAITSDGTLSATGGGGGVTYTLANSTVGSNAALSLTGSDSSVSKVQLLSNTLAITQGSDANGPFARFEYTGGGGSGVTQIVAGTNVTISPTSGTGVVTINAIASGAGVSSVGITSSDMTVSNSPITSSGNINLSLNTVQVAKGGTGITSFAQGEILFGNSGGTLSKLAPGTAGQVLTTGGAGADPTWATPGGGGYVLPTASSTTLGGIKVGANLNIDANGVLSVAGVGTVTSVGITSADLTVSNSPVTSSGNITINLNTVAPTKGGTGLTSYSKGDIIYSSAANSLAKLGIGSTGQVLTVDATGVPVWASGGGGGGYVLPPATTSVLGGVIVGTGLSVNSSGVISNNNPTPYSLPAASASGLGGVIVGTGLSVNLSGVISGAIASSSSLGMIKTGTGLTVAPDGTVSVAAAVVPGSSGQMIYNNSSSYGATQRLSYSETNRTLMVGLQDETFAIVGGASQNTTSFGGNLIIQGGVGQSTFSTQGVKAGNVTLAGGDAPSGGFGGDVNIRTGVSSAGSGTLYLSTGAGTTAERLRIIPTGAWGLSGANYGTAGQVLTSNGSSSPPTWTTVSGGGGSGTVTSVGLTMPTGFTVGSSPVTTSGTIAVTTALNGIVAGNGSGFTTVTVGSGLSYTGGTLSATGGSYTLPPATTSVLGGVIVGTGLSVNSSGVISNTNPTPYSLPIASASTLGGIKVGSGLAIATDGTLSVSGGGGGGVTQIIAGTGVTISPTGGTGAVTINATGSGGGSEPAIVAFKYTAGGSGTFNSAGGAADVIISQTGGVTAALTDPSNCIVTFTFTGRTTPPKSIMIYGQNYSANAFSTISVGLGANNVINGGGTAASPALITGFTSANTVKLQLTMSATGASAGVGQRAHCMVVFGF